MKILCQGCGSSMGSAQNIQGAPDWHTYCGECNARHAQFMEQERELEIAANNARFNRLIAKYGYETACEIAADGG